MQLMDALFRRIVKVGELTVAYPDGERRTYGRPQSGRRPVAIRFHNRGAIRRILRNPRLGVGEAYTDGGLTVEEGDVYDLLDLVTHNARWEQGGGARKAIRKRYKLLGKLDQFNWRARSRRNVA